MLDGDGFDDATVPAPFGFGVLGRDKNSNDHRLSRGGGCLAQGLFRHWLPLDTRVNSLGGKRPRGKEPCPVKFIRQRTTTLVPSH